MYIATGVFQFLQISVDTVNTLLKRVRRVLLAGSVDIIIE